MKINFDSSCHLQERKSASSILATNDKGFIMEAYTYLHVNIADAFIAEAKACEQVVLFAEQIGFRRVQIEGIH